MVLILCQLINSTNIEGLLALSATSIAKPENITERKYLQMELDLQK